jgi:hypothetical protein
METWMRLYCRYHFKTYTDMRYDAYRQQQDITLAFERSSDPYMIQSMLFCGQMLKYTTPYNIISRDDY